jgi:hypothetical protein
VFPNRLTRTAQPLATQPPTHFQTQLNTNEHELFTYPRYEPLRSFTSFESLHRLLTSRTFHTRIKIAHKKTQKNTRRSNRVKLSQTKISIADRSPCDCAGKKTAFHGSHFPAFLVPQNAIPKP